jgi:hypothetical protein
MAQILTVLLVLLDELTDANWVTAAKQVGLWTTFALTLISWIHYTILAGQRLRATTGGRSAAA